MFPLDSVGSGELWLAPAPGARPSSKRPDLNRQASLLSEVPTQVPRRSRYGARASLRRRTFVTMAQ